MVNKITLIYVYDPLCGWCFGFHPVVQKIKKRFNGQMNLEVKPGGLAIGEGAGPISEHFSDLHSALNQVEKRTGAEFGKNFRLLAEEGSYHFNSEPPCRAQVAVNMISPDHALDFAGKLHHAIFAEGKNLNQADTYPELIEEFDIDPDRFMELFKSDKTAKILQEEIRWSRESGATGFPALLIRIGDQTSLMTRGYRPFDTIESHLHHLINNLEKISKA
ncbi:DsbA family protein [Rhodohalobacter sp. SW132]|uniref:DsbA family protein n=1 Tax=Rhodohalobacter sp. SW132 TaxID=2293433 RepID=UPI000E24228C|nr:DsbA family protein [Rhodohalobacter sp. SW132]REL38475.1 DsbA family protein [Rhodohalobacter sp. SW132]